MQGLQGGVTILCGGSFVHVPEALHGRDVALDALFGNVEFGNEAQQATVVTVEEHRAAVVASCHHAVLGDKGHAQEWEELCFQL